MIVARFILDALKSSQISGIGQGLGYLMGDLA
jgi:hypothetical protein